MLCVVSYISRDPSLKRHTMGLQSCTLVEPMAGKFRMLGKRIIVLLLLVVLVLLVVVFAVFVHIAIRISLGYLSRHLFETSRVSRFEVRSKDATIVLI